MKYRLWQRQMSKDQRFRQPNEQLYLELDSDPLAVMDIPYASIMRFMAQDPEKACHLFVHKVRGGSSVAAGKYARFVAFIYCDTRFCMPNVNKSLKKGDAKQ